MKTRNTVVVVLIGLMLAASGGALAQGAGGGNGSAGGGSNSTGNTPAAASDERGGNAAYPDQSAPGTGSTSNKSMQRSHTTAHTKTKKPMNDTTNTPGADASSDTKGQ